MPSFASSAGVELPLQALPVLRQLAALHQEALAKITPLLGTASGVAAYKQYGGYWLENLAPRPAPTK